MIIFIIIIRCDNIKLLTFRFYYLIKHTKHFLIMRVIQLSHSILMLFICCLTVNFAYAQDATEYQNETTPEHGQETVYEYAETPEYIFIKRRNFLKNFDEIQLEILATYDYPKYVSTNDEFQIELDIKNHWEKVEAWEAANAHQIDEILDALGISQ